MALPSKEELSVLETFRGRVADILTEDQVADTYYLLRWLRARDLNLDKAEEMLRNAIKWRKDNNLDNVIISKPSNPYYHEHFTMWLDGIDMEGRPVFTVPFGKWDVRKVVKEGKSDEFITYLTECFEEVSHAIKAAAARHPPQPGQPPITQMVGIYDWDGFPWGQLFNYKALQNLLQIGSIYEQMYPEILHSLYFINCPSLISSVMTLLKPVLAPKTMNKIKCFGTDKKVWQEEILNVIDADQLRPQFGGTMQPMQE